jgi:two-component system cell cycle sensor histidine kinase/response regulator CckA
VDRPYATILLADDEKVLRTLLRIALTQRNYEVLEAADGQRALSVARRHSGPIDLLVTELSLPRVSGTDLAQTLISERPQLKVLFTSRRPHSSKSRRTVLSKPFDVQLLLSHVEQELGNPAARKPPRAAGDKTVSSAQAANQRRRK